MGLLSLNRVSKRYWRGQHEIVVLDEASLELDAGDLVAVWGRRGAGKSTLLRIAAGMEVPDRGTVSFDGRDLASLRGPELADLLRNDVGIADGSGPLVGRLTMLDYVAMPLLDRPRLEAHRRAAQALKRVGVADCSSATWDRLSDGERALVSVAHAVVRGPRLLLVDDTAHLDAVERDMVLDLLRSAAREAGIAVLTTTADIPSLPRPHRVISLSDGRLLGAAREPAKVVALGSRRPADSA